MNILALDLGTKTGWAYRADAGAIFAGTLVMPEKTKGADCCAIDPRLPILRNYLRGHWAMRPIHCIAYEDVQFQRGRAQAHLWSAFRTVVWLFAHDHKIPTICCPVKTLKKFGCGSGNGDKDAMALAYLEKTGQPPLALDFVDDNAIDAWHLLHWAEATLASPLTTPKKSTP